MIAFRILLIICIIVIVAIFINTELEIKNLNSKSIKFKNFNFQGIECIDDKIYIVSAFDSKIYKLNENLKLVEYLDTTLVYKNKYIFSNVNSFYIKDKIFYGVNSMANMNGVMVKSFVPTEKNTTKLSDLEYEIINLDTNINHIEYQSNGNEILINHNQSTKNNKNSIKIFVNKEFKCQIKNNIAIQNIYFDKRNDNIILISNLFKHYVGMIYKLPIRQLCDKQDINFFNVKNKQLIIFPFYELEGYAVCKNKEFFVYINGKNSHIYIK
jgi:hypothetical protein